MISKIIADELIHKTQKAIDKAENIVIVVHVGPDGDAMGSALGLWHYLMSIDKSSTVIVPNAFPQFLAWMPGAQNVLVYDTQKQLCNTTIALADTIFALDFNQPSRLDKLEQAIVEANAMKIMVDHHLHPSDFANVVISYPEISSTSELIFRLICRMGDFSKINIAGAECIYTGMMTDTGAFTYNSNKPEIYSIIFELIKLGVDKDAIYRKVFNNHSADRMRLQGYAIAEKMKIFTQNATAITVLNKEELTRFNYQKGDCESLVNIPLSIKGIVFSVFIREDTDKIKLSFRSQGSFPANKVAADLFNGGGHLNAAGGESYETLQKTVDKLVQALDDYKDFL